MSSPYLPSIEDMEPLVKEINASYQQYIRATSASPGSDSSHEENESSAALLEQAAALGKAARQLRALVADPDEWMIEACWSYLDVAALSSVITMKIPGLIPADGHATAESLAKATGASVDIIMRVMRQCGHRSIFKETSPGCYEHNHHSRRLLDPHFCDFMDYIADDGLLTGAYLTRNLAKTNFHVGPDNTTTAFCDAFKTRVPIYEYYGTVDAARGERFSKGMVGYFEATEKPIETLFPFSQLAPGCTIVDIGAATGANAIRLITLYPQLNCVVQDYGDIVSAAANAAKLLPKSVYDRIVWDGSPRIFFFFSYSPSINYLFGKILISTPATRKCVQMFKNVVHGMAPQTSTLLILDWVDPPSYGEDRPRVFDSLDMHMIAQTNVHSRSLARWDAMLRRADARLVRYYTKVSNNGCAALAVRLEE
ncbi:S-adenosyl-L-methionine-dependent methyltransferase [Apiospora rasikravindrae]|uniref:S-adenosyl-L-methionine-dependent methyltransferase n=1 Tax=Apiospora rasikravindrae TaxID=990691 RepID=A0ABR1SKU5_9PEZI